MSGLTALSRRCFVCQGQLGLRLSATTRRNSGSLPLSASCLSFVKAMIATTHLAGLAEGFAETIVFYLNNIIIIITRRIIVWSET